MILKRGDTFRNPQGNTWRLLDIYRNEVRAEAVEPDRRSDGFMATGLTATIARRELEGWERASDASASGLVSAGGGS